jgi:hypothetical protein
MKTAPGQMPCNCYKKETGKIHVLNGIFTFITYNTGINQRAGGCVMKRRIITNVLTGLAIISIPAQVLAYSAPAMAAPKTTWFEKTCLNNQVKATNTKVITRGRIEQASSEQKLWEDNSKILKGKTRSYKLTKQTKYYSYGEDVLRISKKDWKKLVNANNGLGMIIQVKGGKVTKAVISS